MRAILRAETFHQTQCFLLLMCRNFAHIHDEQHRSLAHWAAASGNVDLLEWLITQFHVDINHKVCFHFIHIKYDFLLGIRITLHSVTSRVVAWTGGSSTMSYQCKFLI